MLVEYGSRAEILENFIHMAAIEILISIPIWQSLFLLSISLNTLVQTK
ncbi:hypothetical protein SNSL317_A2711 [Salmonella enterica subsp. enterica serovar Newport str. SL317]|nr:hypothetical protein SNSL317_A2711 [Salmonella enterica subsp. enterica serovar Newport str. SL317]